MVSPSPCSFADERFHQTYDDPHAYPPLHPERDAPRPAQRPNHSGYTLRLQISYPQSQSDMAWERDFSLIDSYISERTDYNHNSSFATMGDPRRARMHSRNQRNDIEQLPPYQVAPQSQLPWGGFLPPPYSATDPLNDAVEQLAQVSLQETHRTEARDEARTMGQTDVSLVRHTTTPVQPYRPTFAIDQGLQSFTHVSDIQTPPKSILINVVNEPWRGLFYSTKRVYARYNFTSQRMWVAVQLICMSAHAEHRGYSLTWRLFDDFVEHEERVERQHEHGGPRRVTEKFVPLGECCWEGKLNESALMVLWDRKNVEGMGVFAHE